MPVSTNILPRIEQF